MPIYMDRHDLSGLTARDVAEGHRQDLKIQHRYNCRALTYWFDEKRGTAFCLIEAPDKRAVHDLHNESHGLIPNRIIEVDDRLVEAFLGRIEDPEPDGGVDAADLLVLQEPAFRFIMAVTIMRSATTSLSDIDSNPEYNRFIQEAVERHAGREVHQPGTDFTASFVSANHAVRCALDILKRIKARTTHSSSNGMQVSIGLSAGDPVTEKEKLFGEVVRMANRLSYLAQNGRLLLTHRVLEHVGSETARAVSDNDRIKSLNPEEEQFLNRLMDVTEGVWNREALTVAEFSREMGLSKSRLYRNITALTGYSSAGFIKEYRLQKAIRLIEKRSGTIAEIAYETGFNTPSYFSKCFRKRFGISPSGYARNIA